MDTVSRPHGTSRTSGGELSPNDDRCCKSSVTGTGETTGVWGVTLEYDAPLPSY